MFSSSHAEEEQADGEHHRHEDVEAVEPAQLGEVHQVAHALQVRREALLRQEPAHVRAQEAVLDGRVHVLRPCRSTAWWWRWCAAHQSGPRCTAEAPSTPNRNWPTREVLKEWCEK